MDKRDLKKLSKSQLIKMLLKQEKKKPEIIVVDDTKKAKKPKQQKKVYNHGNLFNDDPFPEFVVTNNPFENRMIKATNKGRDINEQTSYIDKKYKSIMSSLDDVKPSPKPSERPIPKPRTYKPVPAPRTYKSRPPVPTPRTKIKLLDKALNGYTKSYEITIKNNKSPLIQLQKTRLDISYHIMNLLKSIKGLKYVETLKITFMKYSGKEIVIKTAFFNTPADTILNDIDIKDSLKFSIEYISNKIGSWISEGSGWTIESVDNHYLNIVKYQPIRGSSYVQLPEELRNSAKGLINLKNKDDECLRWCHIRHLNPQEKYPQRIKKSDKEYVDKLNYSGIEFPVTIKQINKIEKQNNIRINVFGYEEKQPFPIYVSKEKSENQMNLLLITKDENKHYVLIKDFNKFMYQQTKHKERKHFCMHCLQCFSSERVLNNHKDNCIQINGIQAVKLPEKVRIS